MSATSATIAVILLIRNVIGSLKDFAPFTRFFNIELKGGKMVLAPGGVHYGVAPGTLMHGVEVKAVDSLTIV